MPISGINQSTLIVGALLAGFVIWLAVNNRFGAYYNILVGPGGGTAGSASPSAPSINPASPGFNLMQWGQQLGCQLRQFFGGTC